MRFCPDPKLNLPIRIVRFFFPVVVTVVATFAQSPTQSTANGNADDFETRFRIPPSEALWNESPDLRVRSFAGTATYRMEFSVPSGSFDHERRGVLDLGAVHDLAEIVINGKAADVLWTPPFRVDVTDLILRGPNRLEIRVTNTWHNWRLQNRFLPVKHPWAERGLSLPPMKAGLVGPVRLVWNERRTF
jgi:hypothetical protein